MNEFRRLGITYACGVLTGLLLFLLFKREPGRIHGAAVMTQVVRDTVRVITPYPATVSDSVVPRFVYVRRFKPEATFDTILIQKRDTAYLSAPFEAVDTNRVLASGDTLARVSFRFPENLFAYDFRPRPDTAWRFRETVTSIPAAPPGHWSLGLTTGYGGTVTQDPAGNLQARLGPFVGLGISYRLIEF